MATATQKQQYLNQIQSVMTEIGQLSERAAMLAQVFVDRAYDGAAADPITAEDLAAFGLAPEGAPANDATYHLGAAINLLQQLTNLLNGEATSPSGAYAVAVNKWRVV